MEISFQKSRIEICGRCKGTGVEDFMERTSGHEFEMKKNKCAKCSGSGRIKVTTKVITEPFTQLEKQV
jgi:DnaJ-class molecular chaperone